MSLIQGHHACCSLHVCFSMTICTTSGQCEQKEKLKEGVPLLPTIVCQSPRQNIQQKWKFLWGLSSHEYPPNTLTYFSTCIPLVGDRYFLYIIMPQLRVLLIIIIIIVLILYTEYFSNLFQYSNKFLLFFISSWVSTHGIWSYDKTHSSPLPVHQKICGKHTYTSAATTTIQKYYFPKTELELFIPD